MRDERYGRGCDPVTTNLWEMNCPSQQRVFVRPRERQILTESVSSISIEACFMGVCWWDTAFVFWQKVPLLFLWPPFTMIRKSSISNSYQMFIRVCSSRLLWYQIDVLRCNSILSESCLVSSNKLAWLSPDPILDSDTEHYHPVMRLSISYLPGQETPLRKAY